MPRFAASGKGVTDPVLLRVLAQERIDPMGVEFKTDYAHRGMGKEHGPYSKWYINLNGPQRWCVISGLPMVDGDGARLTPGWQFAGPQWFAKKNLYNARIQGRDVSLTVRNDDPFGRKKGAVLSYSPRLFVGGVEIPAAAPVLLPVDPWNPNYQQNVLEWDYGVCKRKLRTVEGRVHGYWVFPANPGGDVLIRYGQTGDYRLKLGQFKQNDDEEFIPASVFASASYPFEVSDSATYYPDASPETTSVDGYVWRIVVGEEWATLIAGAGTNADDSDVNMEMSLASMADTDVYGHLRRIIAVFDTSGLPDAANISAATLSLYGFVKLDNLSVTPNLNVYASTPASNMALAASDYGQTGTTAFSTALTYAGFTTGAYNDFALNANGLLAISKTSVSKFSLRNANYDVAAIAPAWSDSNTSYLTSRASEQGDGYKPKLVVTYTNPVDYPRTAEVALGLSV